MLPKRKGYGPGKSTILAYVYDLLFLSNILLQEHFGKGVDAQLGPVGKD